MASLNGTYLPGDWHFVWEDVADVSIMTSDEVGVPDIVAAIILADDDSARNSQAIASAKLMSASKEMHAALKGLSDEISSGPKHTGMTLVWLDKARDALKKAELGA